MQICIAVRGRFHAFDIARELARQSFLRQLITSYPVFEARKYAIPSKKVNSIIGIELLSRASCLFPGLFKAARIDESFLQEQFDRRAAALIKPGADIFIGWSGCSFQGLKRAKGLGMKTVLERGSSHIRYQADIIKDEYKRHGIKNEGVSQKIMAKELLEYAETDYIEVPSSFAARTFFEQGVPAQKIIMSLLGVDTGLFKPGVKKDDVFRVIYCGALTLRKGVPYLLKSFTELRLSHAELLLIGTVSDEIRPLLEKYRAPNIIVKGALPQSQLPFYYSQSSLFCLASIEDGFGMVIPQAMACGLPVICTDHCAGDDLVRDGVDGFVIPIRDTELLKAKIAYFYENPSKCREMGQSAFMHAAADFNWETRVSKIILRYQQLLSH